MGTFEEGLTALWRKAIQACENGCSDPCGWAEAADVRFLEENGIRPNEVYDFAEDYVDAGVPALETFLEVHRLRRDYFRNVQGGRRSGRVINPAELPPKEEAVAGLPWLPRILAKAKAKLRGELDPDIMYGCGGDRAFLDRQGLTAEAFLRVVRDHEHEDKAVIEWVVRQVGR